MKWTSWLKRGRWERRMDAEFRFHVDTKLPITFARVLAARRPRCALAASSVRRIWRKTSAATSGPSNGSTTSCTMFATLPVTVQAYLEWNKANTSFAAMSALRQWECNLTGDGEPEHLGQRGFPPTSSRFWAFP